MRNRLTSRRRAFVAGVASLALLGVMGCENPVEPDAARINGVDLTDDAFMEDVDAFASVGADPYQLATDSEHSYPAAGVASLLGDEIFGELIDQAATRFGISLDDAELAAAEADLGDYADLPQRQRDFVARQIALQPKLVDYVTNNQWWNDADVEQYARAVGGVSCVRHILVETEDEANEIIDELDGGADFAEIAQERSVDPTSGELGGDLGCQPDGTYFPEFEASYEDAEDGDIVGPVLTSAGYHVILVDDSGRALTEDEAEERLSQGTSGWFDFVVRTAKVHVDSRYGTWDPQTGTVVPPEGAVAPANDGLNFEL